MRVLAVTNDWPTRGYPGTGSQSRQMVDGLSDAGADVEVLFLNRRRDGMGVYLKASSRIQEMLNFIRFDLVHVTYGGVMAERVVSAVRHCPTIVSFCGSDLLGENLSGVTRKMISNLGVLASHRAARRSTRIIVKSRNLERALPTDVSRNKIHTIPNGVDMALFKPLDKEACCRRLGWDKNLFHILFPANGGDAVKRMDLARDAAQRLQFPHQFHALTGVKHEDVPVWLNAADVLLLTSRHEGSPNIVKEALACNRPLVSVDVGDVAARIIEIPGCHLAKPDASDVSSKLRQVHAGPRWVNARARVAELSLPAVSIQIIHIYRDTIRQWQARGEARTQQGLEIV